MVDMADLVECNPYQESCLLATRPPHIDLVCRRDIHFLDILRAWDMRCGITARQEATEAGCEGRAGCLADEDGWC